MLFLWYFIYIYYIVYIIFYFYFILEKGKKFSLSLASRSLYFFFFEKTPTVFGVAYRSRVCGVYFIYYDSFLEKFPLSKKIYYGAGNRFYPTSSFKKYDLFLVFYKIIEYLIYRRSKYSITFIQHIKFLYKTLFTHILMYIILYTEGASIHMLLNKII